MSSRCLPLAFSLSLLLVSATACGQPTDQPIPDAEARQAALASIRELFEKEIEAAKTAKQKGDLARQLIKLGDETADDPTARFVLYRVARDLAADSGQLDLAMQAIKTLAAQYQVQRGEMVIAMLQRAARADRSRSHRVEVARGALEAAETELDDGNHAAAKDLVDLAVTAARSARDTAMIKRAVERRAQIETLVEQSSKVSAARATLQNDPSDAAANQVLGVFYCFLRNQWEDGLPHLALGENKIHQNLAARELAGADAAAERLKLADDWWDLAEQHKDAEQAHIRQHASVWYDKSLPELNGLEKIKVERRLAEIKKSAGPTKPPIGGKSKDEPEPPRVAASSSDNSRTVDGIAADPGGDREPPGVKSKLMGTQPNGAFEDTGPKGSLLVGFRTSTRNAFNGNCIGSIQPIYEAQRSARYWGASRGTENENITTVVAKDGYAVGAINARAGLVVNGFEIIFMRRTRTGLDPRDFYKSQWLGRTDGGSGPTVLGGNGRPVVGIFGAADSRLLLGIGLIGAQ